PPALRVQRPPRRHRARLPQHHRLPARARRAAPGVRRGGRAEQPAAGRGASGHRAVDAAAPHPERLLQQQRQRVPAADARPGGAQRGGGRQRRWRRWQQRERRRRAARGLRQDRRGRNLRPIQRRLQPTEKKKTLQNPQDIEAATTRGVSEGRGGQLFSSAAAQ
ncbi:Protein of unknown function, partial [Gryllus bimaculatus]